MFQKYLEDVLTSLFVCASWMNHGCIMVFLWRLGSFKGAKLLWSFSQLPSPNEGLVIIHSSYIVHWPCTIYEVSPNCSFEKYPISGMFNNKNLNFIVNKRQPTFFLQILCKRKKTFNNFIDGRFKIFYVSELFG